MYCVNCYHYYMDNKGRNTCQSRDITELFIINMKPICIYYKLEINEKRSNK